MAKVTLNGATAHTAAAAQPAQRAPARRPSQTSSRQVAASARALTPSASSGKGACTPPLSDPSPAMSRV